MIHCHLESFSCSDVCPGVAAFADIPWRPMRDFIPWLWRTLNVDQTWSSTYPSLGSLTFYGQVSVPSQSWVSLLASLIPYPRVLVSSTRLNENSGLFHKTYCQCPTNLDCGFPNSLILHHAPFLFWANPPNNTYSKYSPICVEMHLS